MLIFSIIERSVLMALVFYYKDMLEKVTMQRTQQLSGFVCYRKNPVKVIPLKLFYYQTFFETWRNEHS